jgi:hypothetical protein
MTLSHERAQYVEAQALAVRQELNDDISSDSLEDFAFKKLRIQEISHGNGASWPGVMGTRSLWYGATIKDAELLYLAHEIGHVLLDTHSQEECNCFSRIVNQKSKLEYNLLWNLDGFAQFAIYWPIYLLLTNGKRAEYLRNHSTRKVNPYSKP